MSPLNRGPLVGNRLPPAGMRPILPPRFGGRLVHGMPPRVPLPMNPVFGGPGPMRQRLPLPPRPAGVSRPNGLLPLFPGPRACGMAPGIVPPIIPRGVGLRNPMRHWYRRIPPPPPQMMPPMRPRFATSNGNIKVKTMNNTKKVNKFEELELKKPWMTDEIRTEIQKKNKLYAKAKKNKNAVEWDEFKDLRNKVTRMIRDAKNEYFAKHPEQAYLCPNDEKSNDQSDENDFGSKDNTSYYRGVRNINFLSEYIFTEHKCTHKLYDIDDCTLVEHSLFVAKHSMQHNTDSCENLKDLSKEEAARKWTEERRKRFPTKDNIILRETENLEKLSRGEIIQQRRNILKTTNIASMHRKMLKPYSRIEYKIDNYSHSDETYRSLRPFPEISILQEENWSETCLNEKTNFHKETTDNISDKNINLCTPSLVTNYETEEKNASPEERMQVEDLWDYKITENTIFKGTFNYAQSCISTSENKSNYPPINEKSQNPVIKRQDKYKYKTNQIVKNKRLEKVPSRYHNNLLEKLLSRSIQHERNLIFQSLKYIINNNFFELS